MFKQVKTSESGSSKKVRAPGTKATKAGKQVRAGANVHKSPPRRKVK